MNQAAPPSIVSTAIPGAGRLAARRVPGRERLAAAFVALALLAVLITARIIEPSPAGHGTHTQITGLQPCLWAAYFDKPCPTCGMTTAFAHATRGRLITAFVTQPFGAFLAVVAVVTMWISAHVALTGSTLGRAASSMVGARVLWLSLAGFLLGWVWKLATWKGY